MAIIVAYNWLRINHAERLPLLYCISDLLQLIKINLWEWSIQKTFDFLFFCVVFVAILLFLKEQTALLIGEQLDSLNEVGFIIDGFVRHAHNKTSINEGVRVYQLVNVFDRVDLPDRTLVQIKNHTIYTYRHLQ